MTDATGGVAEVPAEAERQRPLVGLAAGVGAGAAVVAGWYLASLGTKSQLLYLTVAVGIAVGAAVNTVAHRDGALVAVMAVVVTFIGCIAGYYLVGRANLVRRGYVHLPDGRPMAVMPSYTLVRDVLRVNLRRQIGPYIWLVAALVAAGILGWRGLDAAGRRADA